MLTISSIWALLAVSAHAATPEDAIRKESLLATIQTLASDPFEGRSPGTPGEEKTVAYLVEQFQKLGLKPGNPDGTYTQNVPLIGATADYQAGFEHAGKSEALSPNQDVVAVSHRLVPSVDVKDSGVVFVGYGVQAPEYGWDDFKGHDLKGKTLLMLVNDPQVPDPKDPSRLDDRLFKGKAMTYYGRWTYKYESAAKVGAAAVLIIHDEKLAGYPWQTVVNSWGRENFDAASTDGNSGRAAIEGWITGERARALLQASGQDLEALKKAALRRDFKPVALDARFTAHLNRHERKLDSKNVAAMIPGRDPSRVLIYSAHWDHFGRVNNDPKLTGDPIFHGAADNASGVAGMLEIARAFQARKEKPRASILFLATTAEERGLLGASYYASHPLRPLERTLADINFDGVSLYGRTRDLQLVGRGSTTLEDDLARLVQADGRTLIPEADPEKGLYYRTDQIEFSKVGVPAIWYRSGIDVIGKPSGYGVEKREEYTAHDYHKPSDVVKPDWDLAGAVEDLRLFYRLGAGLADGSKWPEWKKGAEFAAIRAKTATARK